ncbi:c-type cytochrome [Pelagerythrobacter marinus]|uniref:c-type cytochrome n=1 Tax=Pelagerythrobacter marinus TaxID=538382 RepID=UPI0020371199|nr:c-type cytochrome [Pelagerythrobacter marinus]USA39599.1 c-type cytochrome [Pelagerythrobacter marinus]WPZ06228.1 c-type cytochrome [Pelagerythrobacter marinus]
MTDRFNTAAGWLLFAGIVGLGLSSVSSRYFAAHAPEDGGYPIEGVAEEGEGGEEALDIGALLANADAAMGEAAATSRCGTCHTFNSGGADGQGPNLFGIMGTTIGQHAPGFAYSDALASHGGSWTYEAMFDWLESPRSFAPGTKMSFAGLSSPEDRANIILYMYQNGGGPALPEPLPEEATDEGDTAIEAAEADAGGQADTPEADMTAPGADQTNPVGE